MTPEIKAEMANVLAEYGSPQNMISYAEVDTLLGHIRKWYSVTKNIDMLDVLIDNHGENRPTSVNDIQNILSDIRGWYGR
jgi:hypothetical protein